MKPDEELSIVEEAVLVAYNKTCVVCMEPAVTIHHEPPRSRNPHWKTMRETWFPVCAECHALVHNLSRADAGWLLNYNRDRHFPDVVKRIAAP